MGRFLLGFLLGLCLPVMAGQLSEPPPLKPDLREVYLYFKQIEQEFNNHPVTTTNPNGSIQGIPGDTLYYNASGTWKSCVNISTTGRGTTWRCSANAYTAP